MLIGRILCVVAVLIGLAACTPHAQEKPQSSAIDASGGQITSGDATLDVPAGALSEATTLTMSDAGTVVVPGATVVGAAFLFGPEGQQFAQPVSLSLGFDPARLPPGARVSDVVIYTAPAGSSAFTTVPTQHLGDTHVSAAAAHFSVYVPCVPDAVGTTGPTEAKACDSSADCMQAGPCDRAICSAGQCAHEPLSDATACDDGDLCTVGDHCASGACAPGAPPACDAHASCESTSGACVCSVGYQGDGKTCVYKPCTINNGGCAQVCADDTGVAVCGCHTPAFTLAGDNTSCTSTGDVVLYNAGLDGFLGLSNGANGFSFLAAGSPVHMDPSALPGAFTFTVDSVPGTCADGSVQQGCVDHYRLCASKTDVFRWSRLRSNARSTASGWDSAGCAWLVEEAGGGQVRLKNVGLQQSHPENDYLDCLVQDTCVFTQNEATAGNTLFRLDVDECHRGTASCDANATCSNTIGAYQCACNSGWSGNGATCGCTALGFVLLADGHSCVNACASGNGGCGQLCTGTRAQDGSALCACNVGSILLADGHSCATDSCAAANGGCAQSCAASVTDGSAVCACPQAGFTLQADGHSCKDACATGNGGCDQQCSGTNTDGSATCTCDQAGFILAPNGHTCWRQNACAVGNGGCAEQCLGTAAGQGVCGCAPGEQLQADGKSCAPVSSVRMYNDGLALYMDTLSGFVYFQASSRVITLSGATGLTGTTGIDMSGAFIVSLPTTPPSRLCADNGGLFTMAPLVKFRDYTYPVFNKAECGWIVEDAGYPKVRLKNLALERVPAYQDANNWYWDYLRCDSITGCDFTFEDDANPKAGNTLFTVDFDECGSGNNTCDANATCTNTPLSYSCACNSGYAGDGYSCALFNPCVVGNGGCSQLCANPSNGVSTCSCLPTFTLGGDGHSCAPNATARLYNTGLGSSLNVYASNFMFQSVGADVHVEQTADGPDTFHLTAYVPGSCPSGPTSIDCPDRYRMCAQNNAGYALSDLLTPYGSPDNPTWNDVSCVWKIEPLAGTQVRMKNLWLQQLHASNPGVYSDYSYLECSQTFQCNFTVDGATGGNTIFSLEIDECAAGTDTCDGNATCTNTPTGYNCACKPGFSGDGFSCAQTDACVTSNGGCAQLCTGTNPADHHAICGCLDGFTLGQDGKSCQPFSALRLYNSGLGEFLGLAGGGTAFHLAFTGAGDPVQIEPKGGPGLFTFTVTRSPGFCANGSASPACAEHYRLCAWEQGGFRWRTLPKTSYNPTPAGYDDPECTWIVHPVPGGVRLENLDLDTQYPFVDYLFCQEPYDCAFTYSGSTAGNTLFVIDEDECSAGSATCDTNATCHNTAGSYDCTCNAGYAGNGASCTKVDACVGNNGTCAQLCSTAPDHSAVCACEGGFTLAADQHACTPQAGGIRLYNVGLDSFLHAVDATWPDVTLDFVGSASPVRIDPTGDGPNIFTLSLDYTSARTLRLCVHEDSGLRTYAAVSLSGNPPEWDTSACKWIVTPAANGRVLLENVWVTQQYPYINFLDCGTPQQCGFTVDGDVSGNTAFILDRDECADGSATCSANATCSNTGGAYTCACNNGWFGDGFSCVLTNECVVGNGGCSQVCTDTNVGRSCGCWSGFALNGDGTSCDSLGNVRLFNVGRGGFLSLGNTPSGFALSSGADVHIAAAVGVTGAFTFTVAGGYRLCAHDDGGYRWWMRTAASSEWDSPACAWQLQQLGAGANAAGRVRLKSAGLPVYVGDLACAYDYDCSMNYGDDTSGNTVFVIDLDECAAGTASCGAYSHCANTIDGYDCACDAGFSKQGGSCAPADACVIANGGCDQQCAVAGTGRTCACLPGFALNGNGTSCDGGGEVVVTNVGLGAALGLTTFNNPPVDYEFGTAGHRVKLAKVAGVDTYTLTMDSAPGINPSGVPEPTSIDQLRLCAKEDSGFRAYVARKSGVTPAEWDTTACSWTVEEAGGGLRLKNVALKQAVPYIDYVECGTSTQCGFTYDGSIVGNTLFTFTAPVACTGTVLCSPLRECVADASAPGSQRCLDCPAGYQNDTLRGCIDVDECGWIDACDGTSHCVNNPGNYSCQCAPGDIAASPTSCVKNDACAPNHGGCTQTCTDVASVAVCSCVPGFDLAGDAHACTPWASAALYNDGLAAFVNVAGSGAVSFSQGAQTIDVAPAGTGVFSLAAGANVFCVATSGQLITLPAAQASGNAACEWRMFTLAGARIHLINVWIQQNRPELDRLYCPSTSAGCSFVFNPAAAENGNAVFTVVKCVGATCSAPLADTDLDGRADNNFDGTTDACFGNTGNLDGDRWCDDTDVCPFIAASNQLDSDKDGVGDLCDNCPGVASTNTADQNNDGIGDPCDPTFIPLSLGPDPLSTYNGGNPNRPACGFMPMCPSATGATRFNSYWSGSSAVGGFEYYADEPATGDLCQGDRWWYHADNHIHPFVPGTQTRGMEGVLDALDQEAAATPQSVFEISCTGVGDCPPIPGIGCYGGTCVTPRINDYVDRMSVASSFLSCTGANAWERTFPAERSFRLTQGGDRCVGGYRVENATSMPMAFWVGKKGGNARWWTLKPGESVRFNAADGVYIIATTAEAYRVCDPTHMVRQVFAENLTPPAVQVKPLMIVSYAMTGSGRFTIYRDRDLWMMYQLYEYPNYFDVGAAAGATSKGGWFGTGSPTTPGAIAPVTYTEIDCSDFR